MTELGDLETRIQELRARIEQVLQHHSAPEPTDYPLDDAPEGTASLLEQSSTPSLAPGMEKLLAGLDELLKALPELAIDDARRTRHQVLLKGLSAVIDYFEPSSSSGPLLDHTPLPPAAPTGLEQFIEAFRTEAQKRLSGLSISLMGMFNERHGTKSLEASSGHLHAMRGSAAMLNLKPFAELAGLMEQLIVTMRRVPTEERVWPTKSILRGYNLLEQAIKDPAIELDEHQSKQVCEELRACFEQLATETTLEELSSSHEHPAPRQPAPIQSPQDALLKPLDQIGPGANLGDWSSEPALLEQRILIVDDVETIAASVGFVLSELDVPIDIATNGEEALRMLNAKPYSLVVSDIAMPRMDGVVLTRFIRQTPHLKDIPVILLTSLDHPSERDAGIDAGANDYIIKGSIGGGDLIHRVRELLKIAPYVPITPIHAKPANHGQRRILVTDDAETVAASVAFVLSQGDFDIVLASDGMEALTILERERFDLLMSDWQMPNMSGIELVQAVRASTLVHPLPVILLTSLDTEEARQQALKAGADAFLVKGTIAGAPLLDLVEKLMQQYHGPAAS